MKKILWVAGLLIILYSCDKTETQPYLDGRYIGIFHRTGMDTALINILFDGSRFEGSSNRQNYPAICSGSFRLEENSIFFTDSCMWTANFDWSLILAGSYNINTSDGTVRIWKTNGTVTDEYLLRQPTR